MDNSNKYKKISLTLVSNVIKLFNLSGKQTCFKSHIKIRLQTASQCKYN